MTLPFPELDVGDAEHVAWVKTRSDPALWHACAAAVLAFTGDPHRLVLWMLDQPGLDRATAGYLFLGREGPAYLRGQTEFHGEGLAGADLLAVHEAICRRSAGEGFLSDGLGLAPGFETDRADCLALIDSGGVAPGVVPPRALVATPFPPEAPATWFVEDGIVLDHDPNAF